MASFRPLHVVAYLLEGGCCPHKGAKTAWAENSWSASVYFSSLETLSFFAFSLTLSLSHALALASTLALSLRAELVCRFFQAVALKKGAEMCWSVSSATVDNVDDVADDEVDDDDAASEVAVLFYGGGISLESDVQKNEMTKEEQTPRTYLLTHTHTHMYTHMYIHALTHLDKHTHSFCYLGLLLSVTHPLVCSTITL